MAWYAPVRILVEKGKIGARRSTYGGEREGEQIELYVIRVDLCVPVEAFIRPSDSGRNFRKGKAHSYSPIGHSMHTGVSLQSNVQGTYWTESEVFKDL